jgi:peroxidase
LETFMTRPGQRKAWRSPGRILLVTSLCLLLGAGVVFAPSAFANWRRPYNEHRDVTSLESESLDGHGNNRRHSDWGRANTPYSRVAKANYADGRSTPVAGPNTRFISNRIFSDLNQNLFSERRVSQWGFVWGQFVDHTIGLRDEKGTPANIPFDNADPLESFTNTLGYIPFTRSAAAPGTGQNNPRQQVNTIASYLNASPVYGSDTRRLEWLREGPVDGNMRNNRATLLLPDGLLPRRDSRGNAGTAPEMAVDGRLLGQPARAAVAGDVRANENIGLTATQTLFAREHNRIVAKLPNWMSEEDKFQIARRVVIAEEQYITYREFLPAVGVKLSAYRGYNPGVDTSLSNEFATVGYRAHSMVHGEIGVDTDTDRYTAAQLKALADEGIEVKKTEDGEEVKLTVPLNVAFFNPDVVGQIQLGPLLTAFSGELEYNNDEQIDNQLRSVLFQVAPAGDAACKDNLDGPGLTRCFKGVVDLGAIDVERGRDHGMPSYNDLRRAYGLVPKSSFAEITGESTDAFPVDPKLTPGNEINDPNILDIMKLTDASGKTLVKGTEQANTTAIHEVRRTPLAARLKAIYGSVDKVDAFVGMIAEPHMRGSDLGELQLAIWQRQFQALRDGDRFFYGNDPGLDLIKHTLGIDYRHTLSDIIALNTDIPRADLPNNAFFVSPEPAGLSGSRQTGVTCSSG